MKLLKNLSLIVVLLCAMPPIGSQAYAQEPAADVTASTDVEATMKTISFTYRKAMLESEANEMQKDISDLQKLVASVQLVQFGQSRQQILQQGLTEVQLQLDLVDASLLAGDMAAAKEQLLKVDALKKQYHKKRSPSLWRLLFGSD